MKTSKNFSSQLFTNGKHLIKKDLLQLRKSPTLAANEYQAGLKTRVVKFGFGQSPFPIHSSIVETHKQNSHDHNYYPSSGISKLQDEIAIWIKEFKGLTYNPRNILIGPGTKMMLYLSQLAFDGETVVPSPSWVTYKPQADILNKNIHIPQCSIENKYFITPQDVEDINASSSHNKLYILNSPNNPTGQILDEQRIYDLSMSLRKHKNNVVISDEIYSLYNYKGLREFTSIAKYHYDNVIITDGISKWGNAGGYRIGFAAFPEALQEFVPVLTNLASETFSSAASASQLSALACFANCVNNKDLQEYIKKCAKILEVTGKYVARRIRDMGGLCLDPEGGFYVFGDLSSLKSHLHKEEIRTSHDLIKVLSQQYGVQMLAGANFCRPENELSFRLSFVDFDAEEVLAEVNKKHLHEYTEKLLLSKMPNVVYGMDQIEALCEKAKSK